MDTGIETVPVEPDVELEPTETPIETPASPAPADAPPTPIDGEPLSPETPVVTDVPRDAQGRFTKTDGTLSEPGEAAPSVAPQDTEPDLDTYDQFVFRAAGEDIAYHGAVQDDEGNVLFTPQAVQQLKRDLAYAKVYPQRDAEAQRSLSREKSRADGAEATTQAVLGKLEKLFDDAQGATTIEELLQTDLGKWILARHGEWPRLRAEGLQRGFDLKSKAQAAELDRYRQAEQDAQQRPVMIDRVQEAVQHWAEEAGLDDAGQRAVIARLTTPQALDVIFPRAQQDDPVSGIKAGQRYEQMDVIRQEMLMLHGLLKGRTTAPVRSVATENAARQGKGGQTPPPMAGAGRATATATGKAVKYKNTKEADDDIWR